MLIYSEYKKVLVRYLDFNVSLLLLTKFVSTKDSLKEGRQKYRFLRKFCTLKYRHDFFLCYKKNCKYRQFSSNIIRTLNEFITCTFMYSPCIQHLTDSSFPPLLKQIQHSSKGISFFRSRISSLENRSLSSRHQRESPCRKRRAVKSHGRQRGEFEVAFDVQRLDRLREEAREN